MRTSHPSDSYDSLKPSAAHSRQHMKYKIHMHTIPLDESPPEKYHN